MKKQSASADTTKRQSSDRPMARPKKASPSVIDSKPLLETEAAIYDRLAHSNTLIALFTAAPKSWRFGAGWCPKRQEWWVEVGPKHRAPLQGWGKTERLAAAAALIAGRLRATAKAKKRRPA